MSLGLRANDMFQEHVNYNVLTKIIGLTANERRADIAAVIEESVASYVDKKKSSLMRIAPDVTSNVSTIL